MKKTAQLQNLLSDYRNNLTTEEFASFAREVDRQIDFYKAELAEYSPGIARAQRVHALIEEQIAANANIKVSCHRGCSACCHLEIEITEDDAALLAQSLFEKNLEFNEASLLEQSQRERLDIKWRAGMVAANACVMLGADGACRNYENRPTVCRKHSVISAAYECTSEGGRPVARLIPVNEIILSAALNSPQNKYGSFAKMLLPALENLRDIEKMRGLTFTENPVVPAEADLEWRREDSALDAGESR